jgi:hypothetical protein
MLVVAGCSHPGPFIPTAAYTAQATLAIGQRYKTARRAEPSTYHPVTTPDDEPEPTPSTPAEPSAPEPERKQSDSGQGQTEDATTAAAADPDYVKPYSPEWWARERQEMQRLRHRSTICRGC